MSKLTERVEEKLSPIIKELGYEVVRVMLFNLKEGKTLQLMIEKSSGESATINDCESASRVISTTLEEVNLISGKYNLEISSTGINRPLLKPSDFSRFCGNPVVIKTHTSKNGCKKFEGNLESASKDGISLILDASLPDGKTCMDLSYEEISSAYIDGFKFCKLRRFL
ncbi:MAG: ribosome maturation factor RimP [Holosporales bacterium]|jgi:ribosome maturation factor RimP|nr:ribosome maturation factor RimP [Holosporales bacterium]